MLDRRLTIVKLGGSAITVKKKKFTVRPLILNRLIKELAKADQKPLIVIHGGGSFGHPIAKQYKIVEGYKNQNQLLGFSKTRQAMMSLHQMVVDTFIQYKLPVVAIQPSAFITMKKDRIQSMNLNLIRQFLSLGFIPLLYGDAVLDVESGFTILSGDQIAADLAILLDAKRIVMAVDVDGLFTEDPKMNQNAKLINKISLSELKRFQAKIGETKTTDVTRGMYGKISTIIPAVEHGVEVQMINAKKVNYLYKALKGEKVRGTKISPR